ncbi:LysR family transcriptional regulator [Rhodoplanes sp. TEM]|uniref:LysR family transcriptional regulator n=1 Tax=Rhodoplanes tepidamans TaxID=200616 RepID=A0ABT5JJ83_RHOTP|nr:MULTISPECIES: LysR family transcriptional regulator [Rhodoplanes]MDC7789760.1 LysR family transcriptional regulator [Rhodoplanes tepidamans]MDC7985198.1 LysR family transcriptional regulator [Rhodoplanes sp. TEM]MDQ0354452.1 DNA-binding transcriptional LysR family regulator [Rhodoplanes tepidamans]
MDLLRLKSFLVLAESLHFGRAAARLGVAQPHLSRRIRELEAEIGVRLFARTQRRVELTAAGATLRLRAIRILDEVEKAKVEARQIGTGSAGRLRIGFIHSSTYGVLPAIIRSFRAMRPAVMLDLVEMTMIEQVRALRAGDIDIGLLRSLPDVPDIAFETVLREPFRLAVPADHAFAGRAAVALPELSGEPLVLFPRETSPLFHARITAAFERAAVTPVIVQEATQIHTVMGLVAAGIGLALVPSSAERLPRAGAVLIALTDPPEPADVSVAWRAASRPLLVTPFLEAAHAAAVGLDAAGTPAKVLTRPAPRKQRS